MVSTYPGSIDTPVNPAGGDFLSSPAHAAQHDNINAAVVAIEATLATNPQGASADVKSRFVANEANIAKALVSSIGFVLDGQGFPLNDGFVVYIRVPFACIINEFTLLADQSGSVTVRVLNDTYANFPPAVDISNGGLAIATAQKATTTALVGWTTTLAAGSVIGFKVIGNAINITRLTAQLKVTRT